MKHRNIPGAVPEPDELIGRNHLIDVLWNQLSGNNLMLVAPRRFGKTGIMRHVLKRPRRDYLPVYLDVEEMNAPEDFVAELITVLLEHNQLRNLVISARNIPSKVKDFLKDNIDEVGLFEFKVKLKNALGESWKNAARKLILEMEKTEKCVIFIIDEFPQFLDNISRTHSDDIAIDFLSWFRSLRMSQKDRLRRFRFILGGSTGIDAILRRLQAPDKLNDFFRLPVEPVTREDGESIIKGLAEYHHLEFTQAATDRLFELIGPPVPYFIHLFVSQVILDPQFKDRPLTPEDIEEVHQKRVIGPSCRSYFDYSRQRLARYGHQAEKAAIAVLREIAGAQSGYVSDSILYDVYRKARGKGASDLEFREIMADLECDWYVSLDTATNEYFFLLDIIRAWWNRFYRQEKKRRNK